MPAKAGTQGGITGSRPGGPAFRGNDIQYIVSMKPLVSDEGSR